MNSRVLKVALLLFGSGMCALIYQTAWLREFRLIFGASTAASAAVLAIFMGGLGVGGLVLGNRSDQRAHPLAFYAQLEMLIAISSAITPGLVWLVRQGYIAVGGSLVLGLAFGTVVRLLLAALVLCVPTFLMGGTLPAAARAVETDQDPSRRHLALLYGANTLGAVTGAALSTFLLLEIYGTRSTLWLACLVNLIVALVARSLAKRSEYDVGALLAAPAQSPESPAEGEEAKRRKDEDMGAASSAPTTDLSASPVFVLTAAAIVGFAFLLMEIVWYRMLSPLLGGSTFTFGLILAVALLGIGLGGAAYSLFGSNRPATLTGFAVTCALEAACVAFPYALGDRIALLAILLRPLGSMGFFGHLIGWTEITMLMVFPAAFVSGVQFPMLIALLGKGRESVGRHVGLAYAWNTVGAIVGSLAGGFGLLPMFSAPGTWRAVTVILVLLGLAALGLALKRFSSFILHPSSFTKWLVPLGAAALAVWLVLNIGPTSVWRHSPIGAGRVVLPGNTRNSLRDWEHFRRRVIHWEAEGVESSVALSTEGGFAFVVNGKIDGGSREDAGTQVMGGMIGGILHPNPKRALVVGLGTGSTAGWMGSIPSMERVDAIELEPAILEVARVCAPVNMNVMANSKVHHFIGDAREVLLTTPEKYDLIFSEPSNPYRAGIASLYTQEYYRAASQRLREGGIFLQFLQGYEVDSETVRTAYATISSVFPNVETWQSQIGDLMLVATMKPIAYDVPALRARVQQEPFRSALQFAWRVTNLEGFLAHYVARPSLARAIAQQASGFNTDDRNLLEFGYARSVGRGGSFSVDDLWKLAHSRHEDQPETTGGEINWTAVADKRVSMHTLLAVPPAIQPDFDQDQRFRIAAQISYLKGDFREALLGWRLQPREPADLVELAMLAEITADAGDEKALGYIDALRRFQPTEADALLGRVRWRQGRLEEATQALEAAFVRYRQDPWPLRLLMERTLEVAKAVAAADPGKTLAVRLRNALALPFSVYLAEPNRQSAFLEISKDIDFQQVKRFDKLTQEALTAFEPNIPWQHNFLLVRVQCYRDMGDPRAAQAKQDLDAFLKDEPKSLHDSFEF